MDQNNNQPSSEENNKVLSNQPTMLVRKDSLPPQPAAEDPIQPTSSPVDTGGSGELEYAPTIKHASSHPVQIPPAVQSFTPEVKFPEPVNPYPPASASTPPPEYPASPPPQKGNKKIWLIIGIVLLLLCCCCVGLGVLVQTVGGGLEGIMESLTSLLLI